MRPMVWLTSKALTAGPAVFPVVKAGEGVAAQQRVMTAPFAVRVPVETGATLLFSFAY